MATLDELRVENEAIEEQMHGWKRQRYANGENPMDWVAFREHVARLGAADPGEMAPDEFYRWGDEMVGGEPDAPAATEGSNPAAAEGAPRDARPSAEPHAFGGVAVSEVNSFKAGVGAAGDTSTWPNEAGAGSTTSHWAKPQTER